MYLHVYENLHFARCYPYIYTTLQVRNCRNLCFKTTSELTFSLVKVGFWQSLPNDLPQTTLKNKFFKITKADSPV